MLSHLMVTRAMVGHNGFDAHRHATFSCGVSGLIRRLTRIFR